ncbi:hypothetical protein [Lentilactobacillus kefiri]|uniref:hypothetical protein n=2 Tax=Bacilli TaxID=91061 RepID=UPI000BA7CB49|nr:hypothetical protein [Lentilactobacillus kefiri]PAK82482.1 hypothetical protein B8W85_08245 [Lentilactobacillus kefiri]
MKTISFKVNDAGDVGVTNSIFTTDDVNHLLLDFSAFSNSVNFSLSNAHFNNKNLRTNAKGQYLITDANEWPAGLYGVTFTKDDDSTKTYHASFELKPGKHGKEKRFDIDSHLDNDNQQADSLNDNWSTTNGTYDPHSNDDDSKKHLGDSVEKQIWDDVKQEISKKSNWSYTTDIKKVDGFSDINLGKYGSKGIYTSGLAKSVSEGNVTSYNNYDRFIPQISSNQAGVEFVKIGNDKFFTIGGITKSSDDSGKKDSGGNTSHNTTKVVLYKYSEDVTSLGFPDYTGIGLSAAGFYQKINKDGTFDDDVDKTEYTSDDEMMIFIPDNASCIVMSPAGTSDFQIIGTINNLGG